MTMSFEEEWAQIKEQTARTQLAAANSAGSSGFLKSDRAAWRQAATDVGRLSGNVTTALARMGKGQSGLGGGTDTGSIESAAAQRALYRSWKTYMEKVSKRCTTLQDRLEKAGSDHSRNEQDVQDSFTSLGRRYKDTPAIGGEKQGK